MPAKYIVEVDSIVGTNIWIDTPEWKEWLSTKTSFRYQSKDTQFNCLRRKNGRWYAGKKIYSSSGCKSIALYIGTDKDCNLTKLQEIAEHYSLDWRDFWTWYYSEERKASKKGVQDKCNGTPYAEDLQSELHRLRHALEEMTADRDRQLIRIADMQNRMHSEIQSSIAFKDRELERLEEYNRQIDRANGYLERENAKLRDENYTLKIELKQLRAEAIAPGLEKKESVASHVWSVGSIKPRSELIAKSPSRRHFEKFGNYPVLPDGSKWRRLGSKQELPESEQCLTLYQHYSANTVFYLCIG